MTATDTTDGTPAAPAGKRARRGRKHPPGVKPAQSSINVPHPTHAKLQAVQLRLNMARGRWVTLGEVIDELIERAEPGIDALILELERQAALIEQNREQP